MSVGCLLLASGGVSAWGEVVRVVDAGGGTPLVSLEVSPREGVAAYVVEESIGEGALPTAIAEGGVYDGASGKIKWGPFFGDGSRVLSYRLAGEGGGVELSGELVYGAGDRDVTAVDTVVLAEPGETFLGRQYAGRSVREFVQFPINPEGDGDGDGVTAFGAYAFAVSDDGGRVVLEIGEGGGVVVRVEVNGAAADTAYVLEVSGDGVVWEAASGVVPGLPVERRPVPGREGVDEIVYGPVDAGAFGGRFLARVRADWLAAGGGG